jgi:hypothetical protein
MSNGFKNIVVALWLSLASIGAIAAGTDGEEAHGEGAEHGKHALGPFIGVTRENGESRETIGIEYSYRINTRWSVGGVIERAERDKHSTLAIVFAHWWPYKGLYLGAGVGRKDPGEERENTFRATLGYEFELGGGWGISPQANLDVIEGHENEEVYGIVIGKRF